MMRRVVPWVALLALAATSFAAPLSTPIRVGVFKGIGSGCICWRTSIHTAGTVISSILANPLSENLGPDLIESQKTFRVDLYGIQSGTGTPNTAQRQAFIDALDSLDVVVFPNTAHYGGLFTDSLERKKIEAFAQTRGVVSIHMSLYKLTNPAWIEWEALHGAVFQNYPSSDRRASIHLDTIASSEPDWKFLNRGLADTSFLESWISFTTNGDAIRSTPYLKVTLRIDESTYENGLGGARAMGADHPLSWYRVFPEGGRFFYTAVGGRGNIYQGGNQPRFFRRQLYNAILWAAGVDSTDAVSVRGDVSARASRFADLARTGISGGALTVSLLRDGPHTIELRGLDGRRVDVRNGTGRVEHAFANLRPGVHVVAVTTPEGRYTRRVMVP